MTKQHTHTQDKPTGHTEQIHESHEGHTHVSAYANEKVVLISFLLTFSFMIVEFIGGWLSGSLALIADAGHMLTDTTALALAWIGFYFGRKKITAQKTFGYFRLEILAAFFNALMLFALTGWVAYEAYERLQAPAEVMALPMFIVAVLGLLVNCLVFYILTRGDKEHLNIKSALLHVLGDLLGSVGAIFAAIVIYLTGWMPIDSILSLFVCLLILRSTWRVLKNALHILMEGTPAGIDINEMKAHLKTLPNVKEVDHVHVWSITSNKPLATLNIIVCDEKKMLETVAQVKKELNTRYQIEHSTVEVGIGNCVYDTKGKKHEHHTCHNH